MLKKKSIVKTLIVYLLILNLPVLAMEGKDIENLKSLPRQQNIPTSVCPRWPLYAGATFLVASIPVAYYLGLFESIFYKPYWRQLGNEIIGSKSVDLRFPRLSLSNGGDTVAITGHNLPDDNIADQFKSHISVFKLKDQRWDQLGDDIITDASLITSLSSSGNVVAVNAGSGSTKVFHYDSYWRQLGNEIPSTGSATIKLSPDGNTIAIGNPNHRLSEGRSIGSGQVMVYQYNSLKNYWVQLGNELTAGLSEAHFGRSLALSADGETLAIGAPGTPEFEQVGGNAKVFKFDRQQNEWLQQGGNITGKITFGIELSLSSDGETLAVGCPFEGNYRGVVRTYKKFNENWEKIGGDIIGEYDVYDRDNENIDLRSADGIGGVFRFSLSGDGKVISLFFGFRPELYRTKVFKLSSDKWEQLGSDIAKGDESSKPISISISEDGSRVAISEVNEILDGMARVFEYYYRFPRF